MSKIGEIRPSQLIHTFGIGAIVDLPHLPAMIMGLEKWDVSKCKEINEPRLIGALKAKFGAQVKNLMLPPTHFDDNDLNANFGLPVAIFPTWFRCRHCKTMSTLDSGIFTLKENFYFPEKTQYVHASCTRANKPPAIAVRFMSACKEGHITDFPWVDFVHRGKPCGKSGALEMHESGPAGEVSGTYVKCPQCAQERRMMDAFEKKFSEAMTCSGYYPHLTAHSDKKCEEKPKTIVLGASNSWFGKVATVISLPMNASELEQIVIENWNKFSDIETLEILKYLLNPKRLIGELSKLAEVKPEELFEVIKKVRTKPPESGTIDLRTPEWESFSNPDKLKTTDNFKATHVDPPKGFEWAFEKTTAVERIREVMALTGFTRIECGDDFLEGIPEDTVVAPLSRKSPTWFPAAQIRGEAIFFRLKEDTLAKWESSAEVVELDKQFLNSHKAWRGLRHHEHLEAGYFGVRYVLLHSISHAIMRQISMECGYSAASIRERIYCRHPKFGAPMAGILIYTAANDSEGTLGGLVSLSAPETMGRILLQALETMRLCSSDPLCSEHSPALDGRTIHGAACHSCIFSPETSCEKGNRYLDRSVLVETFIPKSTAFFK